jgi:hypothetical protein
MIGKEDLNEEEPVLKVTDKRKFNPDGSLREGVTLEEEKPKPEETPILESAAEADDDFEQVLTEDTTLDDDSEMLREEDIPGTDDPASFVNFLSTLVSQAAAALGALPHPVTGQRTVDLDTGKYWIEVLGMLREKTEGNLHPQEKQLFDGLMSDLQLQYVSLMKASEEKLKAQAAQKFSAKDILGG